MLSDKTKVSATKWADLKESAMKPNYSTSGWFKDLSKKEIRVLEQLIAAQKAQGDMKKLAKVPYVKKKRKKSKKDKAPVDNTPGPFNK